MTDRDITVAVVALGLDPDVLQIADIMGEVLTAVGEDTGIAEVVELMRARGIRRVVVTDTRGELVGIVAADDVLSLLAEEVPALVSMIGREQKREAALRKVTV